MQYYFLFASEYIVTLGENAHLSTVTALREWSTNVLFNKLIISIKVFQLDGILLESPQWSTDEDVLYCVDVMGQKIFRLDPDTSHIAFRDIGNVVSKQTLISF